MDSLFLRSVLALLPASLLTAQTVTATVAASTSMKGNVAIAGGQPASGFWPVGAGLLHLQAFSTATPAVALASANASVGDALPYNDNGGLSLNSNQFVSVLGAAGSAVIGPGDVVFTVTSTLPVVCRIEVQWTLQSSAGAPLPLVEVDVDNDGANDYVGRSPNTTKTIARRVIIAPLQVRVRLRTLTTNGFVRSTVVVRVLPDTGINVTQQSARCGSSIDLQARSSFDDRLLFDLVPEPGMVNGLRFLVLGAGLAPLPLPTPAPCFLWPTVDAVGLIPIGAYHFAVPVRGLHPVSINAQLVQLGGAAVASQALTILVP